MTPLAYTSIETIPRVLLLVVGLLGLIFSIRRRSGLMVGAFVVMLVTTAAGIAWQFVSLDAPTWSATDHLTFDDLRLIFMGVGLALDSAAVLSWLLVAIAVVKGGRSPRQPGFAPYPGPVGYPMAAQPGFRSPQPGYAQPGPPPAQQPPG